MSHDIFKERLARINGRTGYGASEMNSGDGVACSRFSSPVINTAPTARRNFKPMLMGLLLGMIFGALASGLENPSMPWGPGTDYNAYATIPALAGLCAGPVMAIAAATTRARFPGFFYFAIAYFPAVIAAALVELPLF